MLRFLFYLILVKPLVLIILGINARGREFLPEHGPAIIVANHNSHLDALALMSLFSLNTLKNVRPVAAADYFLKTRWLKWFALKVIGIIPIERKAPAGEDVLAPVFAALDNNAILILFPEGTRGEPENMGKLKNGIGHILCQRPNVPVIPVFFHGLGKILPKGEIILVPFFIDAFIGQSIVWRGNRKIFMTELTERLAELQSKAQRIS
jgi:1-acyl-sn-glycerol-3-phosphate acyltransferase